VRTPLTDGVPHRDAAPEHTALAHRASRRPCRLDLFRLAASAFAASAFAASAFAAAAAATTVAAPGSRGQALLALEPAKTP